MKKLLLILMLVFAMVEIGATNAYAEDYEDYDVLETGIYRKLYLEDETQQFEILMYNNTQTSKNIKITSSNPDVIKVTSNYKILPVTNNYVYTFDCEPLKCGASLITIEVGDKKFEQVIFVKSYWVEENTYIKSIIQPEWDKFKIIWKKYDGCSGYYIKRALPGEYNYTTISTVDGGNITSVTLKSNEWEKEYEYIVVPFVKIHGFCMEDAIPVYEYEPIKFKLEKKSTLLTSVNQVATTSVKISWKKNIGAKGYKIYRSTSPNGTYKCIYTTTDNSKTSYINRVSRGVTYYYKIKTIYPEYTSGYSNTISKMLPLSRKNIKRKIGISNNYWDNGQYGGGNWASSDNVYYYIASGKLNVVMPLSDELKVYTLNSSYKKVKTKTIKIKYDTWGGFYQGTDGNFYVVVGYDNRAKESKTKTVIKVIKYNKDWKKVKTAYIKGGVRNAFQGITMPFDAGNCSMDMQGNTLYIHTCREMFVHEDGLNHQSNISFAVNTKTMKAVSTEDAYSSHSFNQYAKFYEDNLYLLDHGDAYPRAICLTMINNYDKENENSTEYNVFEIKGKTGDNFTGTTVGGMEIGKKNVMICGTSHPHYSRIKGVTGSKWDYAKNVYLITVNKETGKEKLRWITNYNPKTSKVEVGNTRMVKLDDDRFGIMYTTTLRGKETLNYVVVNNEGKKVYSKKYYNMPFAGGSQPILYKGRIMWMATEAREKKVKDTSWGYVYTYTTTVYTSKIYGIPALIK